MEKQGKQPESDVYLHKGNAYYNLCGVVEKFEEKQKALQDAIASYKTYQTLKGDAAEPMISGEIEATQKRLEALGVK